MTGAGALLSLALAALLGGVCAFAGPVDDPRERGLHARSTPTSGGLAILAAVAAGLLLAGRSAELAPVGKLLAFAAVLGLFGAADDMLDLPARVKLVVHAVIALFFSAYVARVEVLPLAPGLILNLGPVAGMLGTTLWLVTLTNAVNFMDGTNGLAVGAVAIAFAALAMVALGHGAPAVAVAAVIAAAANLGFLPWNQPGGRVFQGDAGALFSAFFLGGLAVLAANTRTIDFISPYAVVFATLPMLTDVLLTLLARVRRGAPAFSAHREHLYQRWLIATGATHSALAWRFWLVTAVFAAAGVMAERAPYGWRPLLFGLAVLICAGGWVALRLRLARASG